MTKMNRLIFAAAMSVAAITPAAAVAAELQWHIRSEHEYAVSLEFYSQDRNHVWPGNDEVYVIRDYEVHDYTLTCNNGEKICYGAWVRNDSSSYWGSGYDGKQSCDSCCFTCGAGDTPVVVLNR
jgi:hypothetical protein